VNFVRFWVKQNSLRYNNLMPQFNRGLQDPEPKSKRPRILDEFEDEDSAADMVAMVTQYLSVNEKASEERSRIPSCTGKTVDSLHLAFLAIDLPDN